MNCDCVEKTKEKFLEKGEYEGRQITDVDLPNMLWTFGTNAGKTGMLSYEEFEVELEGLKKPKKVKVAHSYCPFCGVAAGKIDPDQPDNNPLEKQ